MPTFGVKTFEEDSFQFTEGFSCAYPGQNETRWEKFVSQWITCPCGAGGARDAVSYGTRVYLYFEDNEPSKENLIGFTSLGVQSFVKDDGATERRLMIPCLGVSSAFRGNRGLPKNERFGPRLFAGILAIANERREFTHVYLEVDPENPAREKLYEPFGFVSIETYADDGQEWIVMARRNRS